MMPTKFENTGALVRSPGMPFNGNELRARLRQYDRTPFIELLAGWMEVAPDSEAVRAFAKRSPDKFISAIVQIARVAGFADKVEHTNLNLNLTVSKMSDSQIEDHIKKLSAELGVPNPLELEAEFEEISPPTSDSEQNFDNQNDGGG